MTERWDGPCDCPCCELARTAPNRPGGDYRGPARAILLVLVCALVLATLWLAARGLPW